MDNNIKNNSIHSIKNIINTEPFWFVVGALIGLFCAKVVYDISLNNITIGSFLGLTGWALIYGLIYKDVWKIWKPKP